MKEGASVEEKDFRMLRVLKETRSLTRAAERVYMTQSALSKRISALERELGVELLLRSRQGVRFTPEGELVLSCCNGAADALDKMRQELDVMRGSVGGSLKLGACTTYAKYRLPRILTMYRAMYPNVKVTVATGYSNYLFNRLAEDDLDMALIRNEIRPWTGERFRVWKEDYCLVYHRKYDGVPLTEYPYIERKELPGFTKTLDLKRRWLREQGLEHNEKAFAIESLSVCQELLEQGMGWSVVPDVGRESPDLRMEKCRFHDGGTFGRAVYALCQREALELPQVRAFAQLLRNEELGLG